MRKKPGLPDMGGPLFFDYIRREGGAMPELTDISYIKNLMRRHDLRPRKGLGQNFLTDHEVLAEIAEAAGAQGEGIIEIGPGLGALTAELAKRVKKVVAIEVDSGLLSVLAETLTEFENVKIINADVLKTNLNELIKENFEGMPVSVAANLPYYITTPILALLLENSLPLKNIVVMVQREVAERILAKPGGKTYGALTVFISYFADAKLIASVPAAAFVPVPKVDSAVIKLSVLPSPSVDAERKMFFAVVKAAFSQRRKILLNSLVNSNIFGGREEVAAAIEKAGLPHTIRPECLTTQDFARLANIFSGGK